MGKEVGEEVRAGSQGAAALGDAGFSISPPPAAPHVILPSALTPVQASFLGLDLRICLASSTKGKSAARRDQGPPSTPDCLLVSSVLSHFTGAPLGGCFTIPAQPLPPTGKAPSTMCGDLKARSIQILCRPKSQPQQVSMWSHITT